MKGTYYHLKYKLACINHKYFVQMRGDTSCFRYPHLKLYFKNFDSDLKNDIFLLNRNQEEVLKRIALEAYPILKNISNEAYYIEVLSILNLPITKEEKIEAYKSIKKLYKSRKFKKMLPNHYSKMNFKNCTLNEPYQDLKNYMNKSKEYKTYIYKIKNQNMRNLAYSMHGTNILYLDKEPFNFGVGLIESILHNEEGIKGRNLKNLKIEEKYANPKNMALLEIIEDVPKQNPDLFFAKGYLALAFNEKNTLYNLVYALTEPFMKLLFSTIGMKELMDYVFLENESQIKRCFDEVYPEYYEKIYKEKPLFERIEVVKEMALHYNLDIINLYKILFNDINLLNTNVDHKVIAFIYLSKKINQNKKLLFDLIINCYPWSIEHNEKITLMNWSKHVKLKYGDSTYHIFKKEYEKVEDILNKL